MMMKVQMMSACGAQCVEDIIISIEWTIPHLIPRLFMKQIPSTILRVLFSNIRARGYISAKSLPRAFVTMRVTQCSWSGRVEMHELRQSLENFEVQRNNLSGTVRLIGMPPKIQTIDFSRNPLECIVIDCTEIPSSLEWARFRDMPKGFTHVYVGEQKERYPIEISIAEKR